ncbi:hypothetical protein [Lachnobacterium bovis]|uniref:hypothetical protein n=1 Tax=Lachnobacterium bovis TaxID=140626 RepID=UPI0003B50C45|nr:hypothetical protein [Lachnobacterium bovis]
MTTQMKVDYIFGVAGIFIGLLGVIPEMYAFIKKKEVSIVDRVFDGIAICMLILSVSVFLVPAIKASVQIYNNDFITKRGIIESSKPNEECEWRVFEEDNNVYYYEDIGHKYTRGDNVTIDIIPETKEFYKMEVQNER